MIIVYYLLTFYLNLKTAKVLGDNVYIYACDADAYFNIIYVLITWRARDQYWQIQQTPYIRDSARDGT